MQTRRGDGYEALASEADSHSGAPDSVFHRRRKTQQDLSATGGLTVLANGSYSYSYGPRGLSGLRHNYFTLASAVFVSIGGLLFGYDQGVIANVLVMKDFKQKFSMSEWQEGLMSILYFSNEL